MNEGQAVENSHGKIWYGMHFYPGVAEYEEPGQDPFRVFINENTIRSMSPSFAGRPIFVEHVDEVDPDINEVRKEADGWVVESFFNSTDGKTWAKFITVSDRADTAIRRGYRLSNAYIPKAFGEGGIWNGVSYQREVTSAEYEHLAIVRNPRYEESVILTPEEFKAYNEEKLLELKKLSNSKEEKRNMGFKLFKKQKVENSLDVESTMVELPLSKKEMTLAAVINGYDKVLNMHGYANGDHLVKVGDKDEMSVNALVQKHMEACNELADMKKSKEEPGNERGEMVDNDDDMDDMGDESMDNDDDQEGTVDSGMKDVGDRGGDKHLNDEDNDKGEKDEKDEMRKKTNKGMKNALEAKRALRAKADRLRNAHLRGYDRGEEGPAISLPQDQVARGKARYGAK